MGVRYTYQDRVSARNSGHAAAALFALLAIASASAGPASAAVQIGSTSIVVESVTGTVENQARRLVLRDEVHQNEVIETAASSASVIVFRDGSKLSLGPTTRLTLDRFVYDPDQGKGAFVLNIVEGAFRFATGQLSKLSGENYLIRTPTAVMGIRGTLVSGVIAPDGTTAAILDSQSLIIVTGRAGQIVELNASGLGTVVRRDGTLSAPGRPPSWALARLEELDSLLGEADYPADPPEAEETEEADAGTNEGDQAVGLAQGGGPGDADDDAEGDGGGNGDGVGGGAGGGAGDDPGDADGDDPGDTDGDDPGDADGDDPGDADGDADGDTDGDADADGDADGDDAGDADGDDGNGGGGDKGGSR